MKKMKTIEIRKMSDKEIEKHVDEKREAVRQFRFDITGSKAKNVNEGNAHRRDVARLLTEQSIRKAN